MTDRTPAPPEDPLGTLLAEGLETGRYACAVAVVGDAAGSERTLAVGRSDPRAGVDATADTVFDVASLTKPVVTTTVALRLVEDGVLALSDELGDHVSELAEARRGGATVRQLLTHTAGFRPYHYGAWGSRAAAEAAILEESLLARGPGETHEYSCLGFVHLAVLLRRTTGLSLAELARRLVFDPADMTHAQMGPLADPPANTAVTYDHEQEDRRLKGEIHDPIARAMDGESGNAGLFATATDLAAFARGLLGAEPGSDRPLLAPATVEALHADQLPELDDSHGLGWRVAHDGSPVLGWADTATGSPAIGHTGYTGTSLWIDRRRDRFALLLSNEVHEGKDDSFARFRERFYGLAAAGRY
jgi:CubicO group peptidase (beta-lactamase class C family)